MTNLISWQWSLYPDGHRDRANLIIHAITNPIFLAGSVAIVAAPFFAWWLALTGFAAMVLAIALQGRGHKREAVAPVPFRGPLDVVGRLFLEQWVNFPRYVVSGEFARAWSGQKRLEGGQ